VVTVTPILAELFGPDNPTGLGKVILLGLSSLLGVLCTVWLLFVGYLMVARASAPYRKHGAASPTRDEAQAFERLGGIRIVNRNAALNFRQVFYRLKDDLAVGIEVLQVIQERLCLPSNGEVISKTSAKVTSELTIAGVIVPHDQQEGMAGRIYTRTLYRLTELGQRLIRRYGEELNKATDEPLIAELRSRILMHDGKPSGLIVNGQISLSVSHAWLFHKVAEKLASNGVDSRTLPQSLDLSDRIDWPNLLV